MDWTKTFLEVIDFRSFSSIWYWIVLAVAWSQASYYVMGVPFDLIQRARRQGGQAMADLESLAWINVNRALFIVRESGLWLVAFVAFFHCSMLMLGLYYNLDLPLAMELLLVPLTGVGILSLMTARSIESENAGGERIVRLLMRQRFWTQVVGMVSIFVTATIGMYDMLYVPNF